MGIFGPITVMYKCMKLTIPYMNECVFFTHIHKLIWVQAWGPAMLNPFPPQLSPANAHPPCGFSSKWIFFPPNLKVLLMAKFGRENQPGTGRVSITFLPANFLLGLQSTRSTWGLGTSEHVFLLLTSNALDNWLECSYGSHQLYKTDLSHPVSGTGNQKNRAYTCDFWIWVLLLFSPCNHGKKWTTWNLPLLLLLSQQLDL